MADQKQKTIAIVAAVVGRRSRPDRRKVPEESHKNLKTIDERITTSGGQHKSSIKPKDGSSGGMFLHLTVDTPGKFASEAA